MRSPMIYIKIAVNLILFVLGILIVVFLLPWFVKFFLPFIIGWIISMIANPLVKFLEKKVRIVRKHSSAIIIIAVIAVIVAVMYGIISFLINEIYGLMNDFPEIYNEIKMQMEVLSSKLVGIYRILPSSMKNFIDSFYSGFGSYGSKVGTDLLSSLLSKVSSLGSVVNTLLMTIVTILSAYFFIKERDNMARDFKKVLPAAVIKSYNMIISKIKTAVGGYFKAQFKIMLILLVILFVGFELIKVHYSFLLALVVAILDFLPFLGTGVVIWPWAVVEFLVGEYGTAIFLMIVYLVCQIVKQILQPKMVGDSIGISPLSTLIFMFIGYRVMKVPGMIIGIPVGMILISFYQMGMFDRIIRGFQIIIHDINEFRKF